MALKVYADWEQNNSFADGIDDISDDVMEINWRVGMRKPYQMVSDEMSLSITVKNDTGKYNPENTSGTLYGYLVPQVPAKVEFQYAGGTTVMWYGWLDFPEVTWQPAGTSTGKITATLNGVGPKHLLEQNAVALPLYSNTTADAVIRDVLNKSTLPAAITNRWILGVEGRSELSSTTYLGEEADYASLETGVTTFVTYGDDQPNTAWDVIDDVMAGERGKFFFDRDGVATFWNRHHLISDTSNDGTVATNTGSNKPTGLDYTYGMQLANYVRIENHPRQTNASETLWELDTPITVNPSSDKKFEAQLRRESGQFAGASQLTADPTFSQGTALVTVRPQGGKAEVILTNESTTQAAVLSALTLSGESTVKQNGIVIEQTDATSVGAYGKRGLEIDMGPATDFTTAENIAEYEIARRKDPRGEVNWLEFRRAGNGTDDALLTDWPIGTRLLVSAPEVGHSSDYFIIGEEHRWSPGDSGAGVHEGKFYLEPADQGNFWILGVANRSELSSSTYLAA